MLVLTFPHSYKMTGSLRSAVVIKRRATISVVFSTGRVTASKTILMVEHQRIYTHSDNKEMKTLYIN